MKSTRTQLMAFAVVAALLMPCVHAQTDDANSVRQRILGTWKLIEYTRVDSATGAKSDVMGAHPTGYINFGTDGRMIVIIAGSDRKKPAGNVATPQEAEALLRSMLAYAGTYTIDLQAKTVTHHIDVSWDETRTGESHVRTYSFDRDRLLLKTQPSKDPATGTQTVRTLVWEKVR